MTLQVPVNPRPLIAVGDPIRLQAGSPADVEIPHTGGTPPFAWKTGEGSLPAGVRLDQDGRLRGVAKDPGSYTVTVQLEDRWKARTQASLTLQVDPADPNKDGKSDDKKDEAKQDPKDGKQGDQDKQQDGKDPAKPDQAKPDPAKQDPKQGQKSDGKPESKPGEPEPKPGEQADGKQGSAEDQAKQEQQQAASLNQMAADRWLDQLPAEDRGVLRYQLLDGGEKKPDKKGKSW